MRRKPRPLCKSGCGKPVNRSSYTYCSVKCQWVVKHRQLLAKFLSGEYPPIPSTGPSFLRRHLLKKNGERCSRCGWSERNPVTGRVPLDLEHIDGDWRNNTPANLVLLCPNCHSLTPTFKALNKGRGRQLRRVKDDAGAEPADVA
jgi:hypothetical protein